MNNEQNNSIFGEIQPNSSMLGTETINKNNNSFLPPVNSNTNNSLNTSSVSIGVTPEINQKPLESIGTVSVNNGDLSATHIIPVTPVPGIADSNSGSNSLPLNEFPSVQNSVASSELKIDNASPFDIGVNNGTSFVSSMNSNSGMNIDNLVSQSIMTSNATEVSPINNGMMSIENTSTNEISMNNVASGVSVSNEQGISNKEVPLTNLQGNTLADESIVSVGKYLGHMILFSIPVVGIIMLFVKAFGDKKSKNISNFAKAQLLYILVVIVLLIVVVIIFGVVSGSMIANNVSTTYGI